MNNKNQKNINTNATVTIFKIYAYKTGKFCFYLKTTNSNIKSPHKLCGPIKFINLNNI